MFIGVDITDIDKNASKKSIIQCFLTNSIRLTLFKKDNVYYIGNYCESNKDKLINEINEQLEENRTVFNYSNVEIKSFDVVDEIYSQLELINHAYDL